MSPQRISRAPRTLLSGVLGLALLAVGAGGCAGTRAHDALEQARAAVVRAENSAAGRFATDQLMESVKTLGEAESAYCEAPNAVATVDLAVRAQRQAERAMARGEAARQEQQGAPAGLAKTPGKTGPAEEMGQPALSTRTSQAMGAPMSSPIPLKREPL